MPLISAMMAVSRGLRASNSSTTRGRPPVMSLVLVVARGIFASTSPAWTSSPSVHHQVSVGRHQVALFFRPRAAFGPHDDGRHALFIERFGDHPLRHAGDFVHLLLQRDAFAQILEVDRAADFGQNRERVRIPFEQDLVGLDRRAVLEQ